MKRKYIKGRFKIFIIILLFLLVSIFLTLKVINLKVNPILLDYAELESRKLASIIINNAIKENVTDINVNDLFIIIEDNNGDVKTMDFNPIAVNKMLTKTTNQIQKDLKYIEQGNIGKINISTLDEYDKTKLEQGIIYEIPSGVVFGNSFLANIGPKIPVKLNLMGDITSYINTKVNNYGINNALIEVNIVLELSEQVILPFITSKIEIRTSIPVALKLIQGSVPNYYLNGFDQNSASFVLPIE